MRPTASFGVKPRTCSRACRQNRYLKRIPPAEWRRAPCRVCGQLVRFRLGQRRIMCSLHCRRIAYQARQRGEALPRPHKPSGEPEPADKDDVASICPVCEGPMNSVGRKGCSPSCSARIAHWTRSPLPPPEFCGHCRKPLLPRPHSPRRWCSVDCRTQDKRQQRHDRMTAALDQEPSDGAEPEICRGCGRHYRSLDASNPWCSRRCLERGLRECADQQRCGYCGGSTTHCRQVAGRRWCSPPCSYRGSRWSVELRARAQLKPGINEPEPPRPPICRGCQQTFQPLRPSPWCSNQCLEQQILRRTGNQECGACGASMADRKPNPRRKWCSGTCQQNAVRWRTELRERADQAPIGWLR
jgi:hypothetical protein